MPKRKFTAISVFTFVLALSSDAQEQHPGHAWDYSDAHGPSHWGDLKPEFAMCKNGHHQAPIDIRNPQKASLPPIRVDYKRSPLHIIDNGHTVLINYGTGSFIVVGNKKYQLQQFHFHRPSEEKINGKSFDMAVHLVHADDEGKLAVIAILLQKGEDNPLVHERWNEVPREKEEEEFLDNIQINVAQLLPPDLGCYMFSGSLTTPPCSEDVTWFVLERPTIVSAEEIERFSELYRDDARPIQPLYNRIVLESK